MAKTHKLVMYKSYSWKGDKDPVIDKIHTMLNDTGANYGEAAKLSGVGRSTIVHWIEGKTMRPNYCTIAAVAGALGYEATFVRRKRNVVALKEARQNAAA
jgi:transcriptional regulator with XRE-family HTH domain